QLAVLVGASGQTDDLQLTLDTIDGLPNTKRSLPQFLLSGLLNGLQQTPGNPEAQTILANSDSASRRLATMIAKATVTAHDTSKSAKDRAAAIQTLSLAPYKTVQRTLLVQLKSSGATPIQLAILKTLRSYDAKSIADQVLEAWPNFTTATRAEALELLFSRKSWLTTLLKAVEQEDFAKSNITSTRVQYLNNHTDANIRQKATSLFTQKSTDEFEQIIKDYQPALQQEGDPTKGRAIFEERCATCHRFQGVGFQLGPDLSTMAARGAETILTNLIDPNREINPQYVNFTVEMKDGIFLTGLLDSETSTSVTLKRAGGLEDTLLRVNMQEMFSSDLSIMPEGLEDGLGVQGMADLIAFLMPDE
ncbi:MAG: c-type cytochrome, partial [Candidatus Hydrogenedentota bacterium]